MITEPPPMLAPLRVNGLPMPPTPPNACDAHLHIIGPAETFPLDQDRAYDPVEAPAEVALAFLEKLGMSRGVLVQCHVHGTDNSAMLEAISRVPQRLRGVAVIAPTTPVAAIRRLRSGGVRALRFHHLPGRPGFSPLGVGAFEELAPHIAELGMHAHFMCDASHLDPILDAAEGWSFPIVIDHFGCVDGSAGDRQEPVRRLIRLLEEGRIWLKVSAPYRLLPPGRELDEVRSIHSELVRANPDQILWGSDWPHTRLTESMPDDLALLRHLWDWTDDPELVERILVGNPERLFFS